MRVYSTRHGESEANVQEVFSNQPGVHGLTDKGRQQAEALAESLREIDFKALHCSPVLRAVQTAQIVSERLHLPYEIADGLREYDVGILEGRTYDKASLEIYWQVTAQWMEAKNWEARIEGGESYNDITERFMPFIRKLEEAYQQGDANVLLISHGGTLRSMLPLLLSNVDYAYAAASHIRYTTRIVAELRDGEWVCTRWGEDTFES